MARIRVELRRAGEPWRPVGTLTPAEQPGSISDLVPQGRQVIMFGWRDGVPGVWRSLAGLDVEQGQDRMVHSVGWERLADLRDGPHERPVTMADEQPARVRWTLLHH